MSTLRALRLLMWLKWKLLLRGMTRNTAQLISAIILLVVFLPTVALFAIGAGYGFAHLQPPYHVHLLRAVLLSIFALWLFSPVLGYAFNDSYDITRLFTFPVTVRQIFLGAVCGSLLDMTTLFLLPTLGAVLYGFANGFLSALVCLLALALFILHTLSLSQTFLLISAGFLRSRRFRDSLLVLFTLFWIVYYIAMQALPQYLKHLDLRAFLRSPIWEGLNYLPPGLTARAIVAAHVGDLGATLGYLFALAAATFGTLYLMAILVQKVYAGETIRLGSVRSAAEEQAARPERAARSSEGPSGFGNRLPPVVQAVFWKETLYMRRDPYFRMLLLNLVYLFVIAFFAVFRTRSGDAASAFRPYLVWGGASLSLLSEMQLVCNMFGTEGGAIAALFTFPCSRRDLILGKNLAYALLLGGVNLFFVLTLTMAANAWAHLPFLILWTLTSLAVYIALGNIVSIYFPLRVVMKGWIVRQQSANKGCAYSMLYMVVLFGAMALLIPVYAAFLVPLFLNAWQWFGLSIPLALIYAAGLYALSLRFAAPLLQEQEINIIAKVNVEE